MALNYNLCGILSENKVTASSYSKGGSQLTIRDYPRGVDIEDAESYSINFRLGGKKSAEELLVVGYDHASNNYFMTFGYRFKEDYLEALINLLFDNELMASYINVYEFVYNVSLPINDCKISFLGSYNESLAYPDKDLIIEFSEDLMAIIFRFARTLALGVDFNKNRSSTTHARIGAIPIRWELDVYDKESLLYVSDTILGNQTLADFERQIPNFTNVGLNTVIQSLDGSLDASGLVIENKELYASELLLISRNKAYGDDFPFQFYALVDISVLLDFYC